MALKTPQSHRFTDLSVHEVSLVDNPAILSADETEEGVGFPVVKSMDQVPEWVTKGIEPKEGEDYFAALGRLVQACKLSAMVSDPGGDAYWFSPMSVQKDYVLLADAWADPFNADYAVYRCTFTQKADGEFEITEAKKQRLQITYVDAEPESKEEPAAEGTDESAKVVEPEAPAAPAEVVVEAVEVPAEKSVEPEVVEGGEVAPEAEVTKANTGGLSVLFDPDILIKLQQASGCVYKVSVLPDGTYTMDPIIMPKSPIETAAAPAAVAPAAVETTKSVDSELANKIEAMEAQLAAVEVENHKLKQQITGNSSDDALVAKSENSVNTVKAASNLLTAKSDGFFSRSVHRR